MEMPKLVQHIVRARPNWGRRVILALENEEMKSDSDAHISNLGKYTHGDSAYKVIGEHSRKSRVW